MRILLGTIVLLLLAHIAVAEPVTYHFTGAVTELTGSLDLSGTFAVVMAGHPHVDIGPPVFITTAVFLCWILFDLVARARSRPRQRMATAKQREAERQGRPG